MDNSNYNVNEDVELKFPKVWKDLIKMHSPTKQENPTAVLLGGQPGAGKSHGTKQVSAKLNNDVIIINGDDFRSYKEGYEQIYEQYGKDASKHTGDFAGAMVQKVRDEAIKNKFNIIIEGTFRTAEIPLKEVDNFRKHNYAVDTVVCTCPKEISWQSTIERGDNDKKLGIIPRYTPKEHHDLVVNNLPANADKIFQSGKIRHFEVFSRTEKIFDSQKTPNKLPSEAISKELNKSQLQERQTYAAEYLKQRITQIQEQRKPQQKTIVINQHQSKDKEK